MSSIKYKICNRCIMDSSAINIKFNKNGFCSYCENFDKRIKHYLETKLKMNKKYFSYLEKTIKDDSKKTDFPYSCLLGVSGGVDSSYLVYYVKEKLNLNPLLLHIDTGWNNKIAVSNIEKLIDKYNLDLHTEVIDWNELKDLTLAFFLSQVPTIDIVQDHAIWAGMYNFAKKNNIKNILTGGNLYTESVREPIKWAYHATDLTLIKDIHGRFGKLKLKKFPTIDILTYQLFYKYFFKIKIHQPLNHIKYNKKESIKILKNEIGWTDYGSKHHESNFTKFIESYWMPEKFNIDKRKAYLSSLIHSKQMSRDEAIKITKNKSYNPDEIQKDFQYVASKLGISTIELQSIFKKKNKFHTHYKSKDLILKLAVFIKRAIGDEKRLFI